MSSISIVCLRRVQSKEHSQYWVYFVKSSLKSIYLSPSLSFFCVKALGITSLHNFLCYFLFCGVGVAGCNYCSFTTFMGYFFCHPFACQMGYSLFYPFVSCFNEHLWVLNSLNLFPYYVSKNSVIPFWLLLWIVSFQFLFKNLLVSRILCPSYSQH